MNKPITKGMCKVLIEHIDCGFVPLVRSCNAKGAEASRLSTRYMAVLALTRRRLLSWDRQWKPRATKITDLGRAVLAKEIADMADTIAAYDSSLQELVQRPESAVDLDLEEGI